MSVVSTFITYLLRTRQLGSVTSVVTGHQPTLIRENEGDG